MTKVEKEKGENVLEKEIDNNFICEIRKKEHIQV